MRLVPTTLSRRCTHVGAWLALCLTLTASASIARAEPSRSRLPLEASHAIAPRQTLRPRDVAKAPALPTRRPVADSVPLALLLGGLVALWRAAEHHAGSSHIARLSRSTQKASSP